MSVRSGVGSCGGREFAGGSTTDSAKPASGDEAGRARFAGAWVEGGGTRLYASLFFGNPRWSHCRIVMPTPVNGSTVGGFVRLDVFSKFDLTKRSGLPNEKRREVSDQIRYA